MLADNFGSFDKVIRPVLMAAGTPGEAWKDDLYLDGYICATGVTAHGQTDPSTGRFTGALVCISMLEDTHWHRDYHVVYEIDPATPQKRELLAKIALPYGRKGSYMHALAQTQNHVVVIAHPMHMSVSALMEGKPLADGAVVLGNITIFQIVSRKDGSVRQIEHPGFTFAHVVNAWEDGDDILMDLTYMENDERMSFLGLFKMENLQKEVRDKWQHNKIIRFRLRADGSVGVENMLPKEPHSFFELPVINEQVKGQPYCVMWSAQAGSNAYDHEKNSTEVGPAGAYGMAKRNFCTGERSGFYAPGEYQSETKFIPNPEGTEEDDGVLVGFVFDAFRNVSFVQVMDAHTMERVARAELHMRTNFLVHSTWYPEAEPSELIV